MKVTVINLLALSFWQADVCRALKFATLVIDKSVCVGLA